MAKIIPLYSVLLKRITSVYASVPRCWCSRLLDKTALSGCDKNIIFGKFVGEVIFHSVHFLTLYIRISTVTTLVKCRLLPPYPVPSILLQSRLLITCRLRCKIVWSLRLWKTLLGKLYPMTLSRFFFPDNLCSPVFASRLSEMMIQHYTPAPSFRDPSLLTMTRYGRYTVYYFFFAFISGEMD